MVYGFKCEKIRYKLLEKNVRRSLHNFFVKPSQCRQRFTFVKIHQFVHIKIVYFVVGKLYLHKVYWKRGKWYSYCYVEFHKVFPYVLKRSSMIPISCKSLIGKFRKFYHYALSLLGFPLSPAHTLALTFIALLFSILYSPVAVILHTNSFLYPGKVLNVWGID